MSNTRKTPDLSYGLTSEQPDTTVNKDKSTRSQNHYNGMLHVSGEYKILITSNNAQIFINEVKKLQNSVRQKQYIKISNLVDYTNAAKHVEYVLVILSSDASPEKTKLVDLKKQLERLATIDNFYVFEVPIVCKVLINKKELDGHVIAIDDAHVAVTKTAIGNFMVTLANQLEISTFQHAGNKKSSNKIKKSSPIKKSLFDIPNDDNGILTSHFITSEIDRIPIIANASVTNGLHSNKTMRYMKAGKSDNVGIVESIKEYYSDTTSIEDGLCE